MCGDAQLRHRQRDRPASPPNGGRLLVWQSAGVRPLAALYRVIFGSDTDAALRPILGITFAGSLAGSTVWSFVGIWAIKKLGADQSTLGLAYLVSALIGVGAGYLGGHLSDHLGRRPLIFVGWIGQTAVVLAFLAAGSSARAGLLVLCFGGLFFQVGSAASQALVADLVPRERHEPAYAAVRVASNLGVTCGPPLGGLLLLLGSWNALFAGGLTYSGHVLACASAIASIEAFQEEGIVENSAAMGEVLAEELPRLQERHASIGEVRGRGLFWGIELVRDRQTREPLVPYNASGEAFAPVARLAKAAMERGLYLMTHWNVIIVAPPLTITREELDEGLGVLDEVLAIVH